MIGFNKINSSSAKNPICYENGIFITLSSPDKMLDKKISYIDYESGQAKSKLLADKILNHPDPFIDFYIIQQGKTKFIYSYREDKIIDDSFKKYYVTPVYRFPIILKDEYIGYGDHNGWTKWDIKDAKSIKFEANGDYVKGYVNTKSGKKYTIDLWTKKIIE